MKNNQYINANNTVFVLTGADLPEDQNSINHIFKNSQNVKVINIGDGNTGFKHQELTKLIKPHIDGSEKYLNFVVNMHGAHGQIIGQNPEKYYLTTTHDGFGSQVNINAKKILEELNKATNNTPVKMFATSCYGKYLQKHLNLLPKGSILITLSGDGETKILDEFLSTAIKQKFLLDLINKNGFKVEYLLETYCLNQEIKLYNPIIGVHDKEGKITTFKIGDYIQSYAKKHVANFSPLLNKLIELEIIPSEYATSLINQINNDEIKKAKDVKPKLSLSDLVQLIRNYDLDSVKIYLESKFYQPNSLQEVNFGKIQKFSDILATYEIERKTLISAGIKPLEKCTIYFQEIYQKLDKDVEDISQTLKNYIKANNGQGNQAITEELIKTMKAHSNAKNILDKIAKIQTLNLSEKELLYQELPVFLIYQGQLATTQLDAKREQWKMKGQGENIALTEDLVATMTRIMTLEQDLNNANSITMANNNFQNMITYEEYGILSNYNVLLVLGAEAAIEVANDLIN